MVSFPEESKLVDYRFASAGRKMESLAELLRKSGKMKVRQAIQLKSFGRNYPPFLKFLKNKKILIQKRNRDNSLLEEFGSILKEDDWEGLQKKKVYKQKPDQFSYLSSLETKRNIGDSYGRKIRAFLNPPEDGEYTFWILSDDSSILQIAQPGTKNFRKIAEVDSHTGYSWNASVRSEKIFLRKQNDYEIQIIHKEGGGEDFCAVGWTLPSGVKERTNQWKILFRSPQF